MVYLSASFRRFEKATSYLLSTLLSLLEGFRIQELPFRQTTQTGKNQRKEVGSYAAVGELADPGDSKSPVLRGVSVRLRAAALDKGGNHGPL